MLSHNHTEQTDLTPEFRDLVDAIAERVMDTLSDPVRTTREALGPDVLIPYGRFLEANSISYELGKLLRDEGRLKVLRVGSKLMVRKGHASEFVRNLPLDK